MSGYALRIRRPRHRAATAALDTPTHMGRRRAALPVVERRPIRPPGLLDAAGRQGGAPGINTDLKKSLCSAVFIPERPSFHFGTSQPFCRAKYIEKNSKMAEIIKNGVHQFGNVSEYLQFLASTDVKEVFIFQLDNTNNFGNYTITSLTDRIGETDFFDAQLTFLAGNGSLIDTKAYGITKGTSNIDKTYVHTQSVASNTWSITHNLGKFPSVSVVDSAENLVLGDITYTNNNSLTISFSATFSGKAYIN